MTDIAQHVLDHVAASIVTAAFDHDPQRRTASAVAVGPSTVAAYVLLMTWSHRDNGELVVRQGERRWDGCISNHHRDWQTCAVDLEPEADLPVVSPRWSHTISVGETLIAIDARGASTGTVLDSFEIDPQLNSAEPWERPRYHAVLFEPRPLDGALVFDAAARLAGCVERPPADKTESDSIAIPAEWMTGWRFRFMTTLAARGETADRLCQMAATPGLAGPDPRELCLVARLHAAAGRREEAHRCLLEAFALDPGNPWIEIQLGLITA